MNTLPDNVIEHINNKEFFTYKFICGAPSPDFDAYILSFLPEDQLQTLLMLNSLMARFNPDETAGPSVPSGMPVSAVYIRNKWYVTDSFTKVLKDNMSNLIPHLKDFAVLDKKVAENVTNFGLTKYTMSKIQ
jgi:hypothetical protein